MRGRGKGARGNVCGGGLNIFFGGRNAHQDIYTKNGREKSFMSVTPLPLHKSINYNYIKNCFETYFCAVRLQLQLHKLFPCALFT